MWWNGTYLERKPLCILKCWFVSRKKLLCDRAVSWTFSTFTWEWLTHWLFRHEYLADIFSNEPKKTANCICCQWLKFRVSKTKIRIGETYKHHCELDSFSLPNNVSNVTSGNSNECDFFHIVIYQSEYDIMKSFNIWEICIIECFLSDHCCIHSKFKVPQWILMKQSTKCSWLLFQFVLGNCKHQKAKYWRVSWSWETKASYIATKIIIIMW